VTLGTKTRRVASGIAALGVAACGGGEAGWAPEASAVVAVKQTINAELDGFAAAVTALCDAAPAPDADGWSITSDEAAVTSMRSHWREARVRYERVEGAIAVLFPDYDVSVDQRYDGFLGLYGPDADLFDDRGVTGVHAVERILWSNEVSAGVAAFESGLPGHVAPAFPRTESEARAFSTKLCARLVNDVRSMANDFAPLALDAATAFGGMTGSMREQLEKVELASTGEEESRYARHTLADMRANVAGARTFFEAFRPWLLASPGGATVAADVEAGLARLDAAYAEVSGDGLPPLPQGWSALSPSAESLATPFGRLYLTVRAEADETQPPSLVASLARAARAMNLPVLP
jgi:iron uptake system component EfeO